MAVITLNESNMEQISKGVSVVKFGAPWCGPCRQIAPIIESVAGELDGKAVIGDVNIDESQELASKYGIRSVPTTIIFKDGEEVDRIMGFVGGEPLTEKINKFL